MTTALLNTHIKSPRSIHFIAAYDYRFRMNERPFKFSAEALANEVIAVANKIIG